MTHRIHVPVIEIDDDTIDSLLESTLRGGINFWCSDVTAGEDRTTKRLFNKDELWLSQLVSKGGKLVFHYGEGETATLGLEEFLKGIGLYLLLRIKQGGEARGPEDMDANDTNIAIQFALFGKVEW